MPPAGKAPWINILTETFGDDWKTLVNNESYADVKFSVEGKTLNAHKIMLCSSSALFRRLLNIPAPGEKGYTEEEVNSGAVRGFKHIETDSNGKTVIALGDAVTEKIFLRVLEYLYTGFCVIKDKKDCVSETMVAAEMFQCDELTQICQNILDDNEYLNPSFGTYLNDTTGAMSKKLFFNNKLLSDISFKIEGTIVLAHKVVLSARCRVLATMFTSGFMESSKTAELEIGDTSPEAFLAFLEFLYTSHSPIEDSEDSVGILELANRYGAPRLLSLCELYISKEVEIATRENIEKSEIDVIGLLMISQERNANQLAGFCLHFISTNFQPFKKRSEFKRLDGENLKHVEDHQWPPVSYLKALEDYEKLVGKSDKCSIM